MSNGATPAPKLPEEVTTWQLMMMLNEINTRMGRIERVLDIDNLMIRFDRTEQQVLRVETRLTRGDTDLARIQPLEGRVKAIEDNIGDDLDSRVEVLEEEANARKWLYRVVIVAAVSSVVGWVAIVVKWVITSMSKGTP